MRVQEAQFEIVLTDGGFRLGADTVTSRILMLLSEDGQPLRDDAGRPSVLVVQTSDGSSKWYGWSAQKDGYVAIDAEQVWFWTPEWQAKEREADADLQSGNYEEFDDMDDFIDSL